MTSLAERCLAQVKRRDSSECWPWTGSRMVAGYGRLKHQGRIYRAHRLVYELLRGPIPSGLHLDHLCHTRDAACPGGNSCPHRRCVNPAHLEPVTAGVNTMRGRGRAAKNARKTHCKRGHEFTAENTQITARGRRRCRPCAGLTGRGQGWEATVTHCPQGHAYDEINTYRSKRGDRTCRACRRGRELRRYRAQRAAA